jgi:hypothetical protein
MGYTTDFENSIEITPMLTDDFCERFNKATEGTPGRAYVSQGGANGTTFPDMLPNFQHTELHSWCDWQLDNYGDTSSTTLSWNQSEKFYDYAHWLQEVVDIVLREEPEAKFEGTITWQGEEPDDKGKLSIGPDNKVLVAYGMMTHYEQPHPIDGPPVHS